MSPENRPKLTAYLPGTCMADGCRGRYPAVSITGQRCELGCLHCNGLLLKNMLPAETGPALYELGLRLEREGQRGMLVSGGCNKAGELPWRPGIFDALGRIKAETGLHVSVHTGVNVGPEAARGLEAAGVDQALIDVIGDAETLAEVYRLPDPGVVARSLGSLAATRLEITPHVVVGLNHGRLTGEYKALDMIHEIRASIRTLVFVVVMPLRGAPMYGTEPPPLGEVEALFRSGRERFSDKLVSLGCARPVGAYGHGLERAAVELGFDKIAVMSRSGRDHALALGVEPRFQDTCCCMDFADADENQPPAGPE